MLHFEIVILASDSHLDIACGHPLIRVVARLKIGRALLWIVISFFAHTLPSKMCRLVLFHIFIHKFKQIRISFKFCVCSGHFRRTFFIKLFCFSFIVRAHSQVFSSKLFFSFRFLEVRIFFRNIFSLCVMFTRDFESAFRASALLREFGFQRKHS